ncbi:hypothetical protein H4Q26_010167 [Puccinia striiformis f. sp. tritici PST-130]|nr:hypothetical protein H4Q26_010167 [Puccinia striiformis f. sp. tritici PST-130]
MQTPLVVGERTDLGTRAFLPSAYRDHPHDQGPRRKPQFQDRMLADSSAGHGTERAYFRNSLTDVEAMNKLALITAQYDGTQNQQKSLFHYHDYLSAPNTKTHMQSSVNEVKAQLPEDVKSNSRPSRWLKPPSVMGPGDLEASDKLNHELHLQKEDLHGSHMEGSSTNVESNKGSMDDLVSGNKQAAVKMTMKEITSKTNIPSFKDHGLPSANDDSTQIFH